MLILQHVTIRWKINSVKLFSSIRLSSSYRIFSTIRLFCPEPRSVGWERRGARGDDRAPRSSRYVYRIPRTRNTRNTPVSISATVSWNAAGRARLRTRESNSNKFSKTFFAGNISHGIVIQSLCMFLQLISYVSRSSIKRKFETNISLCTDFFWIVS